MLTEAASWGIGSSPSRLVHTCIQARSYQADGIGMSPVQARSIMSLWSSRYSSLPCRSSCLLPAASRQGDCTPEFVKTPLASAWTRLSKRRLLRSDKRIAHRAASWTLRVLFCVERSPKNGRFEFSLQVFTATGGHGVVRRLTASIAHGQW